MLGDGLYNSGTQGSYFKYQYGVLKLLEEINASIALLPGTDYETRTTPYKANKNGTGYSTGDFISRLDIINAATGAITSTLFFNETTALVVTPAPPIADLDPYNAPSNIGIGNWLGSVAPTVGQKTMAASLPVVIASNQSAIPVTLPTGAQTLTSSNETDSTNSPVGAGATSVNFTTDASFVGTINGIARSASTTYSLEAVPGKTLPAIAYTVTAGTLTIDKLV